VKICDFGLSTIGTINKRNRGEIGTYNWMAPEVLRGEEY
jgi:serine/threonine protein kinase